MMHINIHQFVLLLLVCIFQCCRCVPTDFQSTADAAALESQEWQTRLQHMKLLQFPKSISHPYPRDKRQTDNQRDPTLLDTQKKYQACNAPFNRSGHCKHLGGCWLPAQEVQERSPLQFTNYMCIIENTYIGFCCPDSFVSTRKGKMFHDDLASELPVIASLDDDVGEEWNEIQRNEDENGPSANNTAQSDTNLGKDVTSAKQETRKPRRPRGCGTTTKAKTKVAGGQPADPKEWPWMAALLRHGTIQYCGGVLITDRHVLTAAHCVEGFQPSDITVRLGEYDFTMPEETRALDFKVSEIRIHRDFQLNTYEHDIAIVKIHRPTVFNSYIWPICLPPIQQSFENKDAVVTGWGTQYYGGPASTVLLETSVPVWPQERCVRSFTQLIPNTTLCAGAYEGGRDACQGDSGGPLLHQLANGRWVNIGIVSWGIRCGEPGYPGIYTRVSSYLDWIFANAVF